MHPAPGSLPALTAMGASTALMAVFGVSLLLSRGVAPGLGPGDNEVVQLAGEAALQSLAKPGGTGTGPGNGAGNGNGGPGQGGGPGNGAGQGGGPGTDNGSFFVTGDVAGLYPGASIPLTLTFDNPHSFAIDVTQVATSVGGSDHLGCASSSLTVTTWTGSRRVERNATAQVGVQANLSPGAPDACQGATWTLSFSGTAVKAGQ